MYFDRSLCMKMLQSRLISVDNLSHEKIDTLYQLYNQYYSGTDQSLFHNDLKNKQWVILLHDSEQQLRGFTALTLLKTEYEGKPQRILYSGDTVIHHLY